MAATWHEWDLRFEERGGRNFAVWTDPKSVKPEQRKEIKQLARQPKVIVDDKGEEKIEPDPNGKVLRFVILDQDRNLKYKFYRDDAQPLYEELRRLKKKRSIDGRRHDELKSERWQLTETGDSRRPATAAGDSDDVFDDDNVFFGLSFDLVPGVSLAEKLASREHLTQAPQERVTEVLTWYREVLQASYRDFVLTGELPLDFNDGNFILNSETGEWQAIDDADVYVPDGFVLGAPKARTVWNPAAEEELAKSHERAKYNHRFFFGFYSMLRRAIEAAAGEDSAIMRRLQELPAEMLAAMVPESDGKVATHAMYASFGKLLAELAAVNDEQVADVPVVEVVLVDDVDEDMQRRGKGRVERHSWKRIRECRSDMAYILEHLDRHEETAAVTHLRAQVQALHDAIPDEEPVSTLDACVLLYRGAQMYCQLQTSQVIGQHRLYWSNIAPELRQQMIKTFKGFCELVVAWLNEKLGLKTRRQVRVERALKQSPLARTLLRMPPGSREVTPAGSCSRSN